MSFKIAISIYYFSKAFPIHRYKAYVKPLIVFIYLNFPSILKIGSPSYCTSVVKHIVNEGRSLCARNVSYSLPTISASQNEWHTIVKVEKKISRLPSLPYNAHTQISDIQPNKFTSISSPYNSCQSILYQFVFVLKYKERYN